MAISLYLGSATVDSVIVEIDGLNTIYPDKMFDVYLDGSYYNSYTATTSNGSTFVQISGLQSGTSYYCEVRAFCNYGNGDWRPDPDTYGNTDTITITTSSGGGGGQSGIFTYTATVSGNDIIIQITNAESSAYNQQVSAYLYDSPLNQTPIRSTGMVSGDNTRFQSLSSGTYYVQIDYRDNTTFNEWITAQHVSTGQTRSPALEIGGSSGGQIPTFTASVINNNQISFVVNTNGNDCYLRYYVYLTSDLNNPIYDTWQYEGHLSDRTTCTVSNLQYNTSYTVDVGYVLYESSASQYNPNVTLIGSQVLQTGSTPQPQTGYVYIYTNQGWKKAIPYVYTGSGNNQGWKQAIPYIYNGSQWKECGE